MRTVIDLLELTAIFLTVFAVTIGTPLLLGYLIHRVLA